MLKCDVIDQKNKKVGTLDLDETVFGAKVNHALVHQVIKAQLAGRRQGTAKTKTKSEVRGGGRKPFKQKGTGNARQGSTRSPLNVGGGQSFGPVPRSYEQATPKEMMRGALRSALSDRFAAKRLKIVDSFNFAAPKTKEFISMKEALAVEKALFVDTTNLNFEKSGRNVPRIRVLRTEGINVYDIVKYDWLIVSKSAIEAIQKRLGNKE